MQVCTQLQLMPTFHPATLEAFPDVSESLVFILRNAFLSLGIPFLKLILKGIYRSKYPFKKSEDLINKGNFTSIIWHF